jgi:hypothetical protein
MADSSTTPNEETKAGFSARLFEGEQALDEQNVYVSLTYDELNAKTAMDRVKSPKAGAVVLFSGTVFSQYNLVVFATRSLTIPLYSKLNPSFPL